MSKPAIVSVGAGNLATQLIREFHSNGYPILSVYSRTIAAAKELAGKVNSIYTNKLADLSPNAGIYIISLPDDAIPLAIDALANSKSIVVHTAGSIGIEIFKGKFSRYGVIYPLQTFSKSRTLSFADIPFLLEASDNHSMSVIKGMVSEISGNITEMSSEKRKWLHTAAVFACNFTNHMFTCAFDILNDKDLDFALLHPIIKETFEKAFQGNPMQVQTGPASRGDVKVMNEHQRMLNDNPELQKMYNFVSKAILTYHNKEKDKKI